MSAVGSLELLDPSSGTLELRRARVDGVLGLRARDGGGRVVFGAASPTQPPTLVAFDVATGRRARSCAARSRSISIPRRSRAARDRVPDERRRDVRTRSTTRRRTPSARGPTDERPPLRVICHGGPTAHTRRRSSTLEIQFFTQRGIGVVDVNYRGSTGYGREYRRLLQRALGRDRLAGLRRGRALPRRAKATADPDRTWVEGGSAGGYVVFCALVFDPTAFAAGVSYFGVADVEALALDTHKFESRYLDSMIGPYPERARPVSRALAGALRRPARAADAAPAGARRQGRAAEPGGDDGRGARAQGHSVRVPRVRGRGSRLPQAGERPRARSRRRSRSSVRCSGSPRPTSSSRSSSRLRAEDRRLASAGRLRLRARPWQRRPRPSARSRERHHRHRQPLLLKRPALCGAPPGGITQASYVVPAGAAGRRWTTSTPRPAGSTASMPSPPRRAIFCALGSASDLRRLLALALARARAVERVRERRRPDPEADGGAGRDARHGRGRADEPRPPHGQWHDVLPFGRGRGEDPLAQARAAAGATRLRARARSRSRRSSRAPRGSARTARDAPRRSRAPRRRGRRARRRRSGRGRP